MGLHIWWHSVTVRAPCGANKLAMRKRLKRQNKKINLTNYKCKNNQPCQFILQRQGSLRHWGNKQICISEQMVGRRPLWTQFMKIVSQFKIQFRKLSRLTFHCVRANVTNVVGAGKRGLGPACRGEHVRKTLARCDLIFIDTQFAYQYTGF